jgi:protease-4
MSQWKELCFMKAFFRSFFASLLALLVVVFIIAGIAGSKASKKPKIEDHSYLVVDVYGDIPPYYPPDGAIAEILAGGEPETVHRILTNLEKAEVDDRIEGVIMKISSSNSLGAASIEEVRNAIKDVRASGKNVYAFADALDRNSIFLASACDSIFVPQTAYINFIGIGSGVQFVKGTLDKLGIKPNLHKIDQYKSAAEMVTREDMSPEAREMRQWIMDDMWDVAMGALTEDRGLSEPKIIELMEHALFTAKEAKEAGLVDELLYWDELENRLMKEDDKKLKTVSQGSYAKVEREKLGLKGDKTIAVIHAYGMIGGRKSKTDPMLGHMMGHESVVADLRRARLDEDIAAVVFRIESGGGESLASDLIGHEVEILAREKPVVVSMLDVAASGGYHIAYRANKIVADPMTITGSIGSISAKFNTKEFYKKLGITFDHIAKGPNALIYSSQHDFTDEQWERFIENHWAGFNEWLEDVSDHRGIPLETLKTLAMGRVWTGRQAKENGLIDEIGDLDKAIEIAKELVEVPADEEVTLLHYPKKKSLIESILGGGGGNAAVRYLLYRFIREDLTQTIEMLPYSPMLNDYSN